MCANNGLQLSTALSEGTDLAVAYGVRCCAVLIGRGFDLARHFDLGDGMRCPVAIMRDTWDGTGRIVAVPIGESRQRVHTFLIVRLCEVGRPLPRMLDRHV